MTRDRLSNEEREYLTWLRRTLIPDLKNSGRVLTAEDLAKLVTIAAGWGRGVINDLHPYFGFFEYLYDTLIPDLKEMGLTSTAEDFESVLAIIDRTA